MSILWTSPAWSWPLLLVVAAGAIFLTVRFYGQSRPHPEKGLRRTLVILRSAVLFMLVLGVAGPILSRVFHQDLPGQLVYVLEDSASMNLESEGVSSSRWRTSLDFVAHTDSVLSARGLSFESRLIRGNGLGDLQEFQIDDPIIVDPKNHGTHLTQLLEKTGTRLSVDPVRAVVLLSDGQETVSGARSALSVAGFSGVEFVVGGVGDAQGSSDRLIKDLRYAETAFQDDKVNIELTVLQRLTESSLQPMTAYLKQDGQILAEKTVSAGNGGTNLELSFTPTDVGLQMLEIEISPLGNERFLANNKVSLGIDVHQARAKVLYLAQKPGWNVRFLTQAAMKENRLALKVVYATERGLVFADSLTPFVAPVSVDEWLEYDGVILAGWSGEVGRLNFQVLGQAVDAGLGLLVLPDLLENSRGGLKAPPVGLQALLPVVENKMQWQRGPFFAMPDSLAFGQPVFSGLEGTLGLNLLSGTPPLGAVVTSEPRPGSTILLQARHHETDPGSGLPLLVVGLRQAGRTAFWSGSRLWEMAFWEKPQVASEPLPEHAMRRIMRNLLVWLADGSQESGLSFSGRRAFYQEGETIRLAAQWRDMRGQAMDRGRLSLEVGKEALSGERAETRSFPARDYDAIRGEYEFVLPAMPPGRYTIQLRGHGDSEVEGPVQELLVSSHSVEQTQVRQDGRRLRQLAASWRGTYYNLHEGSSGDDLIAQLATLSWESAAHESRRQWNPASGWPFLLLAVLLLACEWFLRRRHGLL